MYSPIYPRKPRARHNRRRVMPSAGPTPPPPPPELVAASFPDGGLLLMAFDEAINIDALDLSQITLNDQPVSGITSLSDPQTLRVVWEGPAPEGDIELSATDASGIVAADGGAEWGGSSGVALPFP